MIEAINVSKKFDLIQAVNFVTVTMKEASVFGLLGTNGAGKSTFLRMLSGILKPDSGNILIDGQPIFEREDTKRNIFYISDDQYFFANASAKEIGRFYSGVYLDFQMQRYLQFLQHFDLDSNRKINTFSKGMKKQLSILCGVCSNTKYLLCDETFDGLDPVVRQGIKSLFANEITERGLTPVIASHNLRELEDICDQVGILHKGGVLLAKDLEDLKEEIHKIQCVFSDQEKEEKALKELVIVKAEHRGSLLTLTVRGKKEEITDILEKEKPLFFELIPLSLEEIFISETEVTGYEIKKLIL